jgi:hypothetical protein
MQCVFAWKLWLKSLSWWGISGCFPKTVDDMCYRWSTIVQGKFRKHSWQLFFTCIVWSLWLHQNDVVFNDATPDLQGCFYLILHRLSLWLKIDRNTFSYTGMNLGISSDGIKFWNNRITHSWLLPFFPLFGLCSLSFRCSSRSFMASFVLLSVVVFFRLLWLSSQKLIKSRLLSKKKRRSSRDFR